MTLGRRAALAAPLAVGLVFPGSHSIRAQPAPGSILRFVPPFDLRSLDPIVDTGLSTLQHGYMIYDTLFALDGAFTPRSQMVDSFDVSPDGLSYAFRLRPGLRFHDGAPVTAADCIASIRRWGCTRRNGPRWCSRARNAWTPRMTSRCGCASSSRSPC